MKHDAAVKKKKVETIQVIYKINFIKRMNRIEGHIKGIKNMMTRKNFCDDILHQIQQPKQH
ncbi:metal-sensing transcriptional repressor [Cytobacillus kochii]|uniref:metal-sensing transcriptional repressor n=1 Tax=Cytobacillus kochii TaxID=859143 RepID=UPI001CD50CDA|nr:metal-sensing transcriptional repressor [Cytobacillus kochii]MCA1026929.1 metal-sensing transcriptional repressor [Cytobacillus kochii]